MVVSYSINSQERIGVSPSVTALCVPGVRVPVLPHILFPIVGLCQMLARTLAAACTAMLLFIQLISFLS